MGQKVNPIAFRMGVTAPWRSRWYAGKKSYGDWVVEDHRIRQYVRKEFKFAGISRVDIERIGEKIRVILFAARPGLLIGKRGAKVDKMSEDIGGLVRRTIEVDVKEIDTPELDSTVIAEAIAEQLQKRSPYRRTMRRHAEMVMDLGAKGIKMLCKGRLGGAEIARSERLVLGQIPLTTLRAKIDYGTATCILSKGTIGVKIWVYKGESFDVKKKAPKPEAAPVSGPAKG